MSKMIQNRQELEETLKGAKSLFVLFYDSGCPFSMAFLPVFEKHAEQLERRACRLETWAAEDCEEQYNIEVVPTVIFFRDGKADKRLDGKLGRGLSERQLVEMIDSCK